MRTMWIKIDNFKQTNFSREIKVKVKPKGKAFRKNKGLKKTPNKKRQIIEYVDSPILLEIWEKSC